MKKRSFYKTTPLGKIDGEETIMKNNTKNNYKGFVRSTSNTHSTTNAYQVNLPPIIWKKMKWKINEPVIVYCNKETKTLEIRSED